jgi:hypothetical protein
MGQTDVDLLQWILAKNKELGERMDDEWTTDKESNKVGSSGLYVWVPPLYRHTPFFMVRALFSNFSTPTRTLLKPLT